jgi:hypothetical protein
MTSVLRKTALLLLNVLTFSFYMMANHAQAQTPYEIKNNVNLAYVAANGAADTVNPGVTCIYLTAPVSPQCTGGWLAIQNNNKTLTAAAFLARTTNATVDVVYGIQAGTSYHCPYLAFTPCTVSSIILH